MIYTNKLNHFITLNLQSQTFYSLVYSLEHIQLFIQILNIFDRYNIYNKHNKKPMSTQLLNIGYTIQTVLKLVFIPMAILNLQYTLLVAFVVSVLAVLRVLKKPQFNKEYAQKILLNNHGQNLMYIGLGAMGTVNFLFYAPLVLFFAFTLVEYVNQKFKVTRFSDKYMPYVDMIRNQKFYVMEGKCKIEIFYFIFLVCLMPLDFLNKLLKVVLMGQYLLMKFKISQEFQYAAKGINTFIDSKTKSISIINSFYNKIIGYVYNFATNVPQQPAQ